jgi:hypothetical protein
VYLSFLRKQVPDRFSSERPEICFITASLFPLSRKERSLLKVHEPGRFQRPGGHIVNLGIRTGATFYRTTGEVSVKPVLPDPAKSG